MGKVNDAIGLVKSGLEVQVSLATAEQKELLADAKNALADIKFELADLKELNASLRDNIKLKEEYLLDKGVNWKQEDTGFDQPYCPVCYTKGKIVPLQKTFDGRNGQETPWHCPDTKCNASFNPWNHEEPTHQALSSW
mgnify:CR=1 FL=1